MSRAARRPHVASPKITPVIAWMVMAIVGVVTLAYWDERRESTAALEDFAHEQLRVGAALSTALSDLSPSREGATPDPRLLETMRRVEEPGAVILLVRPPRADALIATDGRPVESSELTAALNRGDSWVALSRSAASQLGLPARTAVAGIVAVDGGLWKILVVATAERGRDREIRAQVRLLLGVIVASGLVVAFGGLALRKQRKELELSRELAIAAVEKERDEVLVRADKLATMGALATGIAHEVSTPLGVIVGRADQLAPRVVHDDRAKRAVAEILEQSERISRVIRGFLTLARGDSPALERVDPADVARKSTDLVEHRFAKAGVQLTSDVAPNLPLIACEPRLFEQAIVNLLLNACDASDPGQTVNLCVRADRERVAFVVTDSGTGIPPELALRATEPFFTTKPAGQGTGLGLAIAKEIVNHHNGTLTLQPRDAASERVGTRARIEIPTATEAIHG